MHASVAVGLEVALAEELGEQRGSMSPQAGGRWLGGGGTAAGRSVGSLAAASALADVAVASGGMSLARGPARSPTGGGRRCRGLRGRRRSQGVSSTPSGVWDDAAAGAKHAGGPTVTYTGPGAIPDGVAAHGAAHVAAGSHATWP